MVLARARSRARAVSAVAGRASTASEVARRVEAVEVEGDEVVPPVARRHRPDRLRAKRIDCEVGIWIAARERCRSGAFGIREGRREQ